MGWLTLAVGAAVSPACAAAQEAPSVDRATQVAAILAGLDRSTGPASAPRRRVAAQRTLDRLGAYPLAGSGEPKPAGDLPYRGRVLGPGYQRGVLDAGGEARLEQQFMAGQRATIAVAGAPDSPLTLTVAEPGEKPVCDAKPKLCKWLPLYTQRYAIVLRNPGRARVRYYLVLD